MPGIIRILLLLSLILCACAPSGLSTEAPPHTDNIFVSTNKVLTLESIAAATTEVLPPPQLIATVSTPHVDQGPDGASSSIPSDTQSCGYQWAYQDLPELSAKFLLSLQALQPEAQANVFAFG